MSEQSPQPPSPEQPDQPDPAPSQSQAPPPPGDPANPNATLDPPPTPDIDPAELTSDEKMMGMLTHLLGILGFLGPLIIWLIKKDESRFVDDQGKEALNFQLTLLIGWVVATFIAMVTCGIGAILYLPLAAVTIIFSILGGLKAKEGEAYRYPFAIRMVK